MTTLFFIISLSFIGYPLYHIQGEPLPFFQIPRCRFAEYLRQMFGMQSKSGSYAPHVFLRDKLRRHVFSYIQGAAELSSLDRREGLRIYDAADRLLDVPDGLHHCGELIFLLRERGTGFSFRFSSSSSFRRRTWATSIPLYFDFHHILTFRTTFLTISGLIAHKPGK